MNVSITLSQKFGVEYVASIQGPVPTNVNLQLPSTQSSHRTCQAVDDAAAVDCAVSGARLVENFFVRQRLLQYCQPHTNNTSMDESTNILCPLFDEIERF